VRLLAVIDHPWTGSFNHAVLATLAGEARARGHDIDTIDLHADRFDPVMSAEELAVYSKGRFLDPMVGAYQERIMKADYLFLVFPVWWETMPALLKGFFDKVFLPDWAFAEADFSPKLTGLRGATAITTMGAPKAVHTSVEAALCRGTLEACGVRGARWLNFLDVGASTPERRAEWLQSVRDSVAALDRL